MRSVLVAWVGATDINAARGTADVGLGPIAQALDWRPFDQAVLLVNYPREQWKPYVAWLKKRTRTELELVTATLPRPTDFAGIYEAAVGVCDRVLGVEGKQVKLTFHLSPGTSQMAAVWIILAKTRFPAELIESSRDHGVRVSSVPFEISADFIPDLLRERDARLRDQAAATPPPAPEFDDIVHRSEVMARLVQRARRVAARNVPVLIEGESGTGKELFARAIHRASPRRAAPFVALNCGAIPPELVESELFGHKKGAFTSATSARAGHFQSAHGGTLFLDEIGELPLAAQVKLLRTLQEGEVVPVGESKPTPVDVRIVAATNRTLTEEIAAGRFREDLFYRLAVAVLRIPPLRERQGDLGLLLDHLLGLVNAEGAEQPGYVQKKVSAAAKNLLLAHRWPGNVRELANTLRRAALWSDGPTIGVDDVREALMAARPRGEAGLLSRPLGNGFVLDDLLDEVKAHYLRRAMQEAQGTKAKAAALLGIKNYQTLSNWLRDLGVTW